MASRTAPQGRVTLPGGNQELESILLWRDPVTSGVVLGGITVAYILLEWTKYSLLQILANLLLLAVSVAFLWSNIASFTGRSGVPLPAILQKGVSESEMKSIAVDVTAVVNKVLAYAKKLASGRDVILSIQVAAGLWGIAKFSSYFSTLGLAYTVVVLAFILPKVYEMRKDDIDRTFYTVSNETQKTYNMYVDPYVKKLPRGSTATSSSAGNSTAEVQRKVESTVNEATSNVRGGLNQGIDQANDAYNRAAPQVTQAFDNMSQQARQAFDGMTHQAGQAYDQVSSQAAQTYNDTAQQASRTYDETARQASHTYNQTANSAHQTYDQGANAAQRTYDQGTHQTNEAYNRMPSNTYSSPQAFGSRN